MWRGETGNKSLKPDHFVRHLLGFSSSFVSCFQSVLGVTRASRTQARTNDKESGAASENSCTSVWPPHTTKRTHTDQFRILKKMNTSPAHDYIEPHVSYFCNSEACRWRITEFTPRNHNKTKYCSNVTGLVLKKKCKSLKLFHYHGWQSGRIASRPFELHISIQRRNPSLARAGKALICESS